MSSYDSDVEALAAITKTALGLSESDVQDIGAHDPELWELVEEQIGEDVQIWISWLRWAVQFDKSAGMALYFDEFAVNVRQYHQSTFAECLENAKTVRNALSGAQWYKDGILRTAVVSDGVPLVSNNSDVKTIQMIVSIR